MINRPTPNRMIAAPAAYRTLFQDVLATLPGDGCDDVRALRKSSLDRFQALGFPGPKVEAWKYSPVKGLAREAMTPAAAVELDARDIEACLIDDRQARRLVFVNGHFRADLSDGGDGDGVVVADLASALRGGMIDPRDLLHEEDAGARGFSALNAAFAAGGAVITVAERVSADRPVQLLFVSVGDARPTMVNPRNLIRLGAGARLKLVETHLVREGGRQLTNLVTGCTLAQGAELLHDRLQIGEVGGSFIGRIEYRLAAGARLVQTLATLGGGFVRNETGAVLEGPEIEAQFNGLYLTRTGQHVDNMLAIDHAAPNSVSDQYYRGVLDGRAKAAFAGKIMVRRPAQKTNAFQTNNNLLLSPDAEINTKPELEIYADDVKCSHGATAGELDQHELFYLRSRGLDPATARAMLTFAFAGEVLERFADRHVHDQARGEILRWLPGGARLGDLM